MKTRRERRIDRWRLCGAFLLAIAAFVAMLTGCATLPGGQEPEVCIASGEPCVRLSVTNDQFYDASVWINGNRKGTVTGFGKLTILLRQSELRDGGRCITAAFRLIGDRSVHPAGKACLQESGGHFTLQLDPLKNAWLTPWLSGRNP